VDDQKKRGLEMDGGKTGDDGDDVANAEKGKSSTSCRKWVLLDGSRIVLVACRAE